MSVPSERGFVRVNIEEAKLAVRAGVEVIEQGAFARWVPIWFTLLYDAEFGYRRAYGEERFKANVVSHAKELKDNKGEIRVLLIEARIRRRTNLRNDRAIKAWLSANSSD